MTNPKCLTEDDLRLILADGGGDAQHVHLQECAACRALLAEYRLFIAGGPEAAGRNPVDAGRRLDGFIDGLTAPATETAPTRPASPGWLRGFLGGPAWRPALAASVVLFVVAGAMLMPDLRSGSKPSGVLRDASDGSVAGFSARSTPLDDGWRITWDAHPQARSYRLVIRNLEQRPVLELDAGAAREFTLERAVVTEAAESGPWFVQVDALAGGDLYASTPLLELVGSP